MQSIYLDYAAATPLSTATLKAMQPYFSDKFYNPSALYLAAQAVASDVGHARDAIAQTLGVRGSEIIFTAGGTEANNLAIRGIMDQYPAANIAVSAIEHDSVLKPASDYDHTLIPVDAQGLVMESALQDKINDRTVLISIGLVNSEIGVIQQLTDIRRLIDEILQDRRQRGVELPLLLHSDACQAGNLLSLKVHKLGVDMLTLNGGKLYGPKQSGALYVKAGVLVTPQITGGGQEFGIRSGTENVPAVIGLATALADAQKKRATESERMQALQQGFIAQLQKINKEITINGSLSSRIANNVHATFPGKDNERLLMELDERGIQCATGSACSASKDTPSHVLKALGLSDEVARSSLRFSMGRDTTQEQIDFTVQQLKTIL